MKKIFNILILVMLSSSIFAQVPQSFKYQAVIRNSSGAVLANQNVGIKLSILENGDTGSSVYTETWNVTTNEFGLVSLNVGQGETSDVFASINWGSNSYYLQVAIDETGGESYVTLGASQLLSVPYALYANQSANGSSQWINSGSSIYYNTGNVGVGTQVPNAKLEVKAINFTGDTLFCVKDNLGNPVFTVFSDAVQVSVPKFTGKSAHSGRFLVSGRSTNKGSDTTYFVVTPDSTRVYTSPGTKGAAGGFAVGRYATAKGGNTNKVFFTGIDSTRVYTSPGTKGAAGGFAVGRYATAKGGSTNKVFFTGIDSTRIYLKENTKGAAGGFAVGRYATAKGGEADYFNINPSTIPDTINPSEARIVWYPLKEAFLTGRVLIESPDSVGLNSMATGFESKAIGDYSQAMGYQTVAKGLNSLAIGYKSTANGVNSYAFGKETFANDSNCFVFGNKSAAFGKGSFAFGAQDTAIGISSMALGYQTKARGLVSTTMGAFTKAIDTLDFAMGYKTIASGGGSTAMGWSSEARGGASLAMGDSTIAEGMSSLAMGSHTLASGMSSTAMGIATIASGENSTSMGDSTLASGFSSTAMGYQTEAHGSNSIAMGNNTVAWGDASVAMGSETHANGLFSLAIGNGSIADNDASVAIGDHATANGMASFSVGTHTIADGNASVAFGAYTHSVADGSFSLGAFNDPLSGNIALFLIGNGTDENNRHNAFTVLKNGYIGINTNTPDKLLTVEGDARVTGNIYYGGIGNPSPYDKPDFVFNKDYNKDFDIHSIEKFIKKNKHLPWLTSAKNEKEGINMTRMSFETLEAVENQQLQIIELNKQLQEKDKIINKLKEEINRTNSRLNTIEKIIKSKK